MEGLNFSVRFIHIVVLMGSDSFNTMHNFKFYLNNKIICVKTYHKN